MPRARDVFRCAAEVRAVSRTKSRTTAGGCRHSGGARRTISSSPDSVSYDRRARRSTPPYRYGSPATPFPPGRDKTLRTIDTRGRQEPDKEPVLVVEAG